MRRWMMAATLAGWPLLALAQQASVTVENAWTRAALQGRNGAVYLTATAAGGADRLLGARTPVAARAELHESMDEHGVMKMRPVDGIPIAPGKPAVLAPGGLHLMLLDLKQPLKEGQSIPVTLTFEKAGDVRVSAKVEKPGARAPH